MPRTVCFLSLSLFLSFTFLISSRAQEAPMYRCICHHSKILYQTWSIHLHHFQRYIGVPKLTKMWAKAQRDGRPAEYGWRPLFNAAKFGW